MGEKLFTLRRAEGQEKVGRKSGKTEKGVNTDGQPKSNDQELFKSGRRRRRDLGWDLQPAPWVNRYAAPTPPYRLLSFI